MGFAVAFWDSAWDDSAITLAFARVLAETGTWAPTLHSAPVEGSSTLLWTLIHAALAPLIPGPRAHLAGAQGLALGLNLLGIALVCRLALRHLAHPALVLAVTVAYGTLTAVWAESINGMETPLNVVLYLAALLAWPGDTPRTRAVFVASTVVLLLVRWEAAWYLLPFFVLRVRRDGLRGVVRAEHVAWALVFAGLTLWRWTAFEVLVPNTVLAKRFPPYSPEGAAAWWRHHVVPLFHFGLFSGPLAAAAVLALAGAWRRDGGSAAREALRRGLRGEGAVLLALVAAAALVFNTVTGENWGAKGRMFLVAFPAAFVLCGRLVEAGWAGASARARRRTGLAVAALVGVGAVLQTGNAVENTLKDVIIVESYRRVGRAVDAVRVAAGRERLAYAGPDMGGLLLYYGDHLRVLDLGYLCDPVLGRHGPAAVRSHVFQREPADLIEAHNPWTAANGLGSVPELRRDYAVLFVDGIRFFVRRPLLAALLRRGAPVRPGAFAADGTGGPYDVSQAPSRYESPYDLAINAAFGTYAVLGR